jgi:hypothetical protein
MSYESTANELSNRIYELIPANPEILSMASAFDLFKVPGFNCDDLQPSMGQASWALDDARRRYSSGKTETNEVKK